MTDSPVLSVRGLTKSFGSVEVLRGIDLDFGAGEFIGLMGPNGAGKSTLIKILDGVYGRSGGEITFESTSVANLAERQGVGFLHQDLGLVDELSIVENLRLGERPVLLFGPFLDKRREVEMATEVIDRVGLDYDVHTQVGLLSPGEKALVAIARLLSRGVKVLFLDEATSTLPPGDSRRLIGALESVIEEEGATVIMVSHKLSEILDVADRIVLLLDGRVAVEMESSGSQRDELVSRLVAHETEDAAARVVRPGGGKVMATLTDVRGGRAGPVNLELRAGQVTGLTGLPGSGLHDIAHLVGGSMSPRSGHTRREECRTAVVPPNRESEGGFDDLSVLENMTISALPAWSKAGGVLSEGAERDAAIDLIDRLGVVPADPDAVFGTLSGGNKQKVIFGRALLRRPGIYVLCEPTRGVDVATRAAIYRLISTIVDDDTAVLVVSSDSEDLFAVCDEIAVVEDGVIGEFFRADETDPQELEAFI